MHLKVIACEISAREIYHCAAKALNTTDITLLTEGLHDNPETMRERIQEEIAAVPEDLFDAVLLGYGLCNNGTVGVRAARHRLVIPRAHDCITFFLGSKERYAQLFAEAPGTYYYTSGWLEYESREGERVDYTPASGLAKKMALQEYIEKYGEENGRYLFESMAQWEFHYTHGALIAFPFTERLGLAERVQAICEEKNWVYREIPGDLGLVQDWLDGKWDDDRFITVQPGQEIQARYDDSILCARPCPTCGEPQSI